MNRTTRYARLILILSIVLLCASAAHAGSSSPLVVLKSSASGHVIAESDGKANSDGSSTEAGTQFMMIDAGNGKVHFKSVYGKYLTAVGGGGAGVKADANSAGDYETFEILNLGPGNTAIKAFNGMLLCDEGTKLHAKACMTFFSTTTTKFTIKDVGDIVEPDFANVQHQAQIGPNTWTYEADLKIPTPVGDIVFPGADVEITYNTTWGGVESISGTAGMPTLPGGSGCGLWCSTLLGNSPTSTSTTLQIGYARPPQMPNVFDLPLQDSVPYFYLVLENGHQAEWGNLSMSSPDSGAVQLVLDHRTPTAFFFTDFPFGLGEMTGPIESIGFGVSRGDQIPFYPEITTGVASSMEHFNGDVYLGGSVNLSPIEGLDLVLDSDLIIDSNRAQFVSGGEFIDEFGYNGELSYGASVGIFSLSFYLGEVSAYYKKSSGTRMFVFSGVYDPEQGLGSNLPFAMKQNALAWGRFDDNFSDGKPSFVHLEGELDFGNRFVQQEIEGEVELSENYGLFSGKAKLAGTTVTVSGLITSNRAQFSGSVGHNWNVGVGKVKTTVTTKFDTNKTAVDLEVRAQFCSFGSCDSIGASASLNGNGSIKVCANVPGAGTKCDSLN